MFATVGKRIVCCAALSSAALELRGLDASITVYATRLRRLQPDALMTACFWKHSQVLDRCLYQVVVAKHNPLHFQLRK